MKDSDTIQVRIAQMLRALEYTALIILLISLVLRFLDSERALPAAKAGIGLVIFAPVAGIIAVGIISLASRSYKYVVISLMILLIFVIAVVVNL